MQRQLARETIAVVLAGGQGARLGALTRNRCKPALHFGARYRSIDFTLSSTADSGRSGPRRNISRNRSFGTSTTAGGS